MHPRQADLGALIEALVTGGVEFIVVGGAAAVLHGAPTSTRDLDIVHRRTDENVARLLAVLQELEAKIRDPAGRTLYPSAQQLSGTGQLNLTTLQGPLDPLGQLHDGRGYEQLLDHSVELDDGELRIRVIDLDTLIEIKAAANRPRDRIVIPILLALKEEL